MRLRGNNNAASPLAAAVAFAVMGCVIAICALAADFEPYVVQCGLVAYVFVAAPLLFASQVDVRSSATNRSFRLASPAYMIGKRVKPRLRWLTVAGSAFAVAAWIGAIIGTMWAIFRFRFVAVDSIVPLLVLIGVSFVVSRLAPLVFAFSSVILGWMTRKEAGEFLTRRRRWPETWLEPVDQSESI